MLIFIHEILENFDFEINPNKKKEILGRHFTNLALRFVLRGAFHPHILWYRTDPPPEYKPQNFPLGLELTHIGKEIRRMNVFVQGHPSGLRLSEKKKDELLIPILEGLGEKEANVILQMFKKKLKYSGLTHEVVKEIFPGLV